MSHFSDVETEIKCCYDNHAMRIYIISVIILMALSAVVF